MANVLTGRQLFADTAGVLWQTELKIASIVFSNGLVAGDSAVLVDRIGRPVWRGVIGNDLEADTSTKIGWVEGLTLSSISNGNVIIYID